MHSPVGPTALLPLLLVTPGTSQDLPKPGELNPFVLEVLETYPTDGTCRYYWPRNKKSTWAGNTRDMHYRGELFAKGDPKRRSFCCGLTFEVWFFAYQKWHEARHRAAAKGRRLNGDKKKPARPPALVVPRFATPKQLASLRSQWFGSDGNRRCSDHALADNGLGQRIRKLDAARAGDFVQFWRNSGSGHSVIFIAWVRRKGKITGLRYWSTQKATRGIGYREESFGGRRGIDRKQLYITRAGG